MKSSKTKEIIILAIVFGIFIGVSFVSDELAEYLKGFIENYYILGIAIYITAMIIVTVLGPVTLLPIVPVAVSLWGPFWTAVFTTTGWTIGAIIAFLIARKYGTKIVDRLVSAEQVDWLHKRIPEKNIFWALITFRILIPVDFVSYVIGIFTKMRLGSYIVASLIGTFTSTLFLTYAISLPTGLKFVALGLAIGLLFLGYIKLSRMKKTKST